MKSRTGFSVLVGAIPGAIPPMLGYVAATNQFGIEPGTLFAVQFMWQFPHFWAIAWVAHEDYLKAGYKMLPFKEGRSAPAPAKSFSTPCFASRRACCLGPFREKPPWSGTSPSSWPC